MKVLLVAILVGNLVRVFMSVESSCIDKHGFILYSLTVVITILFLLADVVESIFLSTSDFSFSVQFFKMVDAVGSLYIGCNFKGCKIGCNLKYFTPDLFYKNEGSPRQSLLAWCFA